MDKLKRMIAFEKVEKVIESCETIQQLLGADRMIDNFKALYGSNNDYVWALNSLYLEKNCELAHDLENECQLNALEAQ